LRRCSVNDFYRHRIGPRDIEADLQQGIIAVRPLIATWLFPSHTGKLPTSTQQFAAIKKLI